MDKQDLRFISLYSPELIVFTKKKTAMRKIYLLSLLCLLRPDVSSSQDSTKTTTLQEVVISASRTEQRVIEAPRSVSVIGEDVIRNSVYQSVGELLNAQSGLFIVGANQTPGTNQNIFMRGTNSNQVAVLVDGVRITDPSSPNAAIDFSEMSLTNVERIEVIRGAHSTLYGGAAVGGVINIITRKSTDPGVHGEASWQGGTFGKDTWSSTGNARVTYGNASGFYANGSLYRQDAGGMDSSIKTEDSPSFTADRDDFEKIDGLINAGMRREKWDANVTFKRAYQYTEIDDGAYKDDENSYLEFDRTLWQYSGRYRFSPSLDIQVIGSFSNSERFFEDDSSRVSASQWDHTISTGTYYGRLQTHEAQLTYQSKAFEAIAGVGLYHEKMFFENHILVKDPAFPFELVTNYDTIDTRTTTSYAFGRARYTHNRFSMSAGGRLSNHTESGTFGTFEVNPSYLVDGYLIYASLSTGFNPPSLYQLFDPSRTYIAFATRGNADLKPEISLSYEVGVKKEFSSGSYITLSGYQTTVRDGIEYVYLWNGERTLDELDFSDDRGDRYINIGELETRGLELEGMIHLSEHFSLTGNFSWLKTKVRASREDLDDAVTGGHHVQLYNLGRFLDREFEDGAVVRRPSFTSFCQLSWKPVAAVKVDLIHRFTGNRYDAGYDSSLGPYGALARMEVDEYHLADLAAYWQISKVLGLGAKVENILDEDYREVVGFTTRGRGFYVKGILRF